MESKKKTIFMHPISISLVALFASSVLFYGLDFLKTYFPDIELLWVAIILLILVVIILLFVDLYKHYKLRHGVLIEKLNNLEKIILRIEEVLNNMNKRGQYEKLVYFIVVVIIFLLILYFLSKSGII